MMPGAQSAPFPPTCEQEWCTAATVTCVKGRGCSCCFCDVGGQGRPGFLSPMPVHMRIVLLFSPQSLASHLPASPLPLGTLSQKPLLPLCRHVEPAASSLAPVGTGRGSAHFPSAAQLPARLYKLQRQILFLCSVRHK